MTRKALPRLAASILALVLVLQLGTTAFATTVDDLGPDLGPSVDGTVDVDSTTGDDATLPDGTVIVDATPNSPMEPLSGTMSGNVSWSMDVDNYTLHIINDGTGVTVTPDFNVPTDQPWYHLSEWIRNVVFDDGIAFVGTHFLDGQRSLVSVQFDGEVQMIGEAAFKDCFQLNTFVGAMTRDEVWRAGVNYNAFEGTAFQDEMSALLPGGVAGDNAQWTFDASQGLLTVSGTGAIMDCTDSEGSWMQYRDQIVGVKIDEGITEVGAHAFENLPALETVVLPASMLHVGDYAFWGKEHVNVINTDDGHTKEEHSFQSQSGAGMMLDTSTMTHQDMLNYKSPTRNNTLYKEYHFQITVWFDPMNGQPRFSRDYDLYFMYQYSYNLVEQVNSQNTGKYLLGNLTVSQSALHGGPLRYLPDAPKSPNSLMKFSNWATNAYKTVHYDDSPTSHSLSRVDMSRNGYVIFYPLSGINGHTIMVNQNGASTSVTNFYGMNLGQYVPTTSTGYISVLPFQICRLNDDPNGYYGNGFYGGVKEHKGPVSSDLKANNISYMHYAGNYSISYIYTQTAENGKLTCTLPVHQTNPNHRLMDINEMKNNYLLLVAQYRDKNEDGGSIEVEFPETTPTYTVKHYLQNLDGTYNVYDTETIGSSVGNKVTANARKITGYAHNASKSKMTGTVTDDNAMTLEVYYDRNILTVSYNTDGGTPSSIPNSTVPYGGMVGQPSVTKNGYRLDHWEKTVNGVTTVFSPSDPVYANMTLKAVWAEEDAIPYTVVYYTQGLDGNYEQALTMTQYALEGTRVTAVDRTFNGMHRNTSHPGNHPTDVITKGGGQVLELYYDRDSVNVTFESNGAEQGDLGSRQVMYGSAVSLPEVTKEGYTLKYWTVTMNGVTSVYDKTPITSEATLRPVWNKNDAIKYEVRHFLADANGNYSGSYTTKDEGSADQGTRVYAQPRSYQGFELDDEYTQGVGKSSGVVRQGESLVLELYYARKTLLVHFDLTDCDQGSYGSSVMYGTPVDLPRVSRTGYTLDGWVKVVDGREGNYRDGDLVVAETTLRPVWVKNGQVTYFVEHILENLDGTYDDPRNTETLTADEGAVVHAQPGSYPGFHLSTKENQNVESDTIRPGVTTTLRLYYDRDQFTVRFDTDGGKPESVNDQTVKYQGAPELPDVEKTGYHLSHWLKTLEGDTEDNGVKWKDGDVISANCVLKAVWVLKGDIQWKVEHWQENLNDDNFTKIDTDDMHDGSVGMNVNADAKPYEGFHVDLDRSLMEDECAADGSTVLKVYYARDRHTVTMDGKNGTVKSEEVKHGALIPDWVPMMPGKEFQGWKLSGRPFDSLTKVTSDLKLEATWATSDYSEYGDVVITPTDKTKITENDGVTTVRNEAHVEIGDQIYVDIVQGKTVVIDSNDNTVKVPQGEITMYTHKLDYDITGGTVNADRSLTASSDIKASDGMTVTGKTGTTVNPDGTLSLVPGAVVTLPNGTVFEMKSNGIYDPETGKLSLPEGGSVVKNGLEISTNSGTEVDMNSDDVTLKPGEDVDIPGTGDNGEGGANIKVPDTGNGDINVDLGTYPVVKVPAGSEVTLNGAKVTVDVDAEVNVEDGTIKLLEDGTVTVTTENGTIEVPQTPDQIVSAVDGKISMAIDKDQTVNQTVIVDGKNETVVANVNGTVTIDTQTGEWNAKGESDNHDSVELVITEGDRTTHIKADDVTVHQDGTVTIKGAGEVSTTIQNPDGSITTQTTKVTGDDATTEVSPSTGGVSVEGSDKTTVTTETTNSDGSKDTIIVENVGGKVEIDESGTVTTEGGRTTIEDDDGTIITNAGGKTEVTKDGDIDVSGGTTTITETKPDGTTDTTVNVGGDVHKDHDGDVSTEGGKSINVTDNGDGSITVTKEKDDGTTIEVTNKGGTVDVQDNGDIVIDGGHSEGTVTDGFGNVIKEFMSDDATVTIPEGGDRDIVIEGGNSTIVETNDDGSKTGTITKTDETTGETITTTVTNNGGDMDINGNGGIDTDGGTTIATIDGKDPNGNDVHTEITNEGGKTHINTDGDVSTEGGKTTVVTTVTDKETGETETTTVITDGNVDVKPNGETTVSSTKGDTDDKSHTEIHKDNGTTNTDITTDGGDVTVGSDGDIHVNGGDTTVKTETDNGDGTKTIVESKSEGSNVTIKGDGDVVIEGGSSTKVTDDGHGKTTVEKDDGDGTKVKVENGGGNVTIDDNTGDIHTEGGKTDITVDVTDPETGDIKHTEVTNVDGNTDIKGDGSNVKTDGGSTTIKTETTDPETGAVITTTVTNEGGKTDTNTGTDGTDPSVKTEGGTTTIVTDKTDSDGNTTHTEVTTDGDTKTEGGVTDVTGGSETNVKTEGTDKESGDKVTTDVTNTGGGNVTTDGDGNTKTEGGDSTTIITDREDPATGDKTHTEVENVGGNTSTDNKGGTTTEGGDTTIKTEHTDGQTGDKTDVTTENKGGGTSTDGDGNTVTEGGNTHITVDKTDGETGDKTHTEYENNGGSTETKNDGTVDTTGDTTVKKEHSDGTETEIKSPDGVHTDGDGNTTVKGDATMTDKDGNESEITGGTSVDSEGNKTDIEGGFKTTTDGSTVKYPEGTKVSPDGGLIAEGDVAIEVTRRDGTVIIVTNGTVKPDGTIVCEGENGKVVITNRRGETVTATGDVTVTTDGTVTADKVVIDGKGGAYKVELPNGGSYKYTNGEITLTSEQKATIGGATIELPNGGKLNVNGSNGTITVPAGGKVTTKNNDGTDKVTEMPRGGNVTKDGKVTVYQPSSGGGHYPSYPSNPGGSTGTTSKPNTGNTTTITDNKTALGGGELIDLTSEAWYYQAVTNAIHRGYFPIKEGQLLFNPNSAISRAETAYVMKMLIAGAKGSGSTSAVQKFTTDVKSSTLYAPEISWALDNRIMIGTSETTFDPTGSLTREQFVLTLYRHFQNNLATKGSTGLSGYSDANRVSGWAKDAVIWAINVGIIQGTSASTIDPQGTVSRAQMATMVMRIAAQIEGTRGPGSSSVIATPAWVDKSAKDLFDNKTADYAI